VTAADRRWYVGEWPPLAWVETAFKGVAQVLGIVALARAWGDDVSWPDGARLAQLVILAVMSLGLLGAVADRIAMREIVSMVFVVPNIVAHWGMVFALATIPGPGSLFAWFCALMLAGEFAKLAFLRTSGFRVRDISPAVVTGLTAAYAAGYGVLLLLELAV
jgi:hypothetical protein